MSDTTKSLFSSIASSTAVASAVAPAGKDVWKHEVWVGNSKDFKGKFCIGGANRLVLPLDVIIGEWGADPIKVAEHLGIYPHRSMTLDQCAQLRAALGVEEVGEMPAERKAALVAEGNRAAERSALVAESADAAELRELRALRAAKAAKGKAKGKVVAPAPAEPEPAREPTMGEIMAQMNAMMARLEG